VRLVQQKISENWLTYGLAHIQSASRVCLNFDINRHGEPSNVRIEQSSGVPSLDESALSAVKRISTFFPLPANYKGDKVSVLFWFDYKPRQGEQKPFAISPGPVTVAPGSTLQFVVSEYGINALTAISWTLGGEACAKSDCGTISTEGLYTAPTKVPLSPDITVVATQKEPPFMSDSAKVTIAAPKTQN
jgi:TonB family protein